MVTGSNDGRVVIFNSAGRVLNCWRNHTDSVEDLLHLSFLPCVASASLDSTVQIWDVNTLQLRANLQHEAGVIRITTCPDTHLLVSGCLDGSIHAWDARAGKLLHVFTGHTAEVLDLTVFGNKIVSGSEDKTVRLWDLSPYLSGNLS